MADNTAVITLTDSDNTLTDSASCRDGVGGRVIVKITVNASDCCPTRHNVRVAVTVMSPSPGGRGADGRITPCRNLQISLSRRLSCRLMRCDS